MAASKQQRKGPTCRYIIVGTGDFENPVFANDLQKGVAEKMGEYAEAGYDEDDILLDITVYEIAAEYGVEHKPMYVLKELS